MIPKAATRYPTRSRRGVASTSDGPLPRGPRRSPSQEGVTSSLKGVNKPAKDPVISMGTKQAIDVLISTYNGRTAISPVYLEDGSSPLQVALGLR